MLKKSDKSFDSIELPYPSSMGDCLFRKLYDTDGNPVQYCDISRRVFIRRNDILFYDGNGNPYMAKSSAEGDFRDIKCKYIGDKELEIFLLPTTNPHIDIKPSELPLRRYAIRTCNFTKKR